MIAFASFILLYLLSIVLLSPKAYPAKGNQSGLTRSANITGWVRCCLLHRRD